MVNAVLKAAQEKLETADDTPVTLHALKSEPVLVRVGGPAVLLSGGEEELTREVIIDGCGPVIDIDRCDLELITDRLYSRRDAPKDLQ